MRASRFAVHITTGHEVKVLVKTKSEMVKIANGIPDDWQNNDDQETYAAYLFESIDTENIINELSIKKDSIMANTTFVQVRVAQALKEINVEGGIPYLIEGDIFLTDLWSKIAIEELCNLKKLEIEFSSTNDTVLREEVTDSVQLDKITMWVSAFNYYGYK